MAKKKKEKKVSQGMHMMEGGMMMSDKEMEEMMGKGMKRTKMKAMKRRK